MLKNMLDELIRVVEELSRTDWVAEAGISPPGLLQRDFLWTMRRDWEYKCNSKYPKEWMPNDNYYHATRWRCILDACRALGAEVLPTLRQSRKDIDDAFALYHEKIDIPGKKLQSQTRELPAGRGWELVEVVEIGLANGQWVEAQQYREQARRSYLPAWFFKELQNVTIWRRIVLPLYKEEGKMFNQDGKHD
jgi:hypothetical protein